LTPGLIPAWAIEDEREPDLTKIFRYPNGAVPNLAAIAYAFLGWGAGVWLLTRPEWALNAAGVALTAHALVYSAYLIHECAHNSIFSSPAANDRLGEALSWLNGSCVATYAGLKEKHLRHHADRLDVVTFDYRAVLRAAPEWVRRCVLALEWAYVPAVEILLRGLVIATPFQYGTRRDRIRTCAVIALRIAFFAGLAWVSLRAILLYALAYLMFVSVLRFMDAFQHTYDVFATRSLDAAPDELVRDRRYEYENTYSNLVSLRAPWLNLLVMNFPYHNAHHTRPAVPWHDLPALHRTLYGDKDRQVMPCRTLLASYHRHRVKRVFADDYGTVAAEGDRAAGYIGAIGVNFLITI
jgi:fatty acid desaturase